VAKAYSAVEKLAVDFTVFSQTLQLLLRAIRSILVPRLVICLTGNDEMT
jgi:hypothetical protein